MPKCLAAFIIFSLFTTTTRAKDPIVNWHKALSEQSVAIAIHGLNMKPQKMDAIIKALNDQDTTVLNLHLQGHNKDYESFKSVSEDIWVSNFSYAYERAKKYADKRNLPLYLFGYSTGAVVALASEMRTPKYRFDKRILMSPAIKFTWLSNTVRLLFPFEFISLPSTNKNTFRAHDYTPMKAYKSLFSLADEVSHSQPEILNRTETLVIMDPSDEIVSFKSLSKLKDKKALDSWSVFTLFTKKDYSKTRAPHHAIIHNFFTGPEVWSELTAKLKSFIKSGT